ncbi:MAG: cytochrome c oxidase subunit II [Pseudanabaena sp.]|jgi:cytochrome c oxidase subunit 2|nr:cytochrome c oxidase subunit II [Pseudanabaena sp. M53BS1SP1A06MG]MCA6583490.1 cytochrome c oxidase subunit II [Pseudanabaena sp. M34BS1SP1A06MG]MCA6591954.1 cytochrome c oxidase subunit II [Pseudanabaena sp. M38BS1SP1A06MG]MCA6598945.1 cytochrome c oxidase subunit II [Pseudanabaena sp. M57BS1SP1A06MG]
MKINNKLISIVVIIGLVIATSIWYGRDNGLLPVAAGDEAKLYDGLFNTILAIAVGFFLIVEGVLLYSIIKFRKRKGDETDGPAIHENLPLEIAWTAIPTIIVMWVAIYSFDVYTAMQGTQDLGSMAHGGTIHTVAHHTANHESGGIHIPKATIASSNSLNNEGNDGMMMAGVIPSEDTDVISINVSAMQFAWIFNYTDEIATAELHVPVGKKIRLNMNAVDVLHAFWVPQLRIKQDVIPGRETYLEFTPRVVGEYPVVCAELCGSYHGGMRTTMVIDTPEDYAKWLKEQQEIASNNPEEIVASRPASQMTEQEYLAGKVALMGMTSKK